MKLYVPALCLLAFVYSAKSACINPALMTYDCRRDQVNPCNGGSCNANNGQCSCIGASGQGKDCLIPFGLTLSTNNICGCQNGGTCYSNGAQTRCDCPPAWTGATCTTCRVDVTCSSSTIVSNIYPQQIDPSGSAVILDLMDPNTNQPITACRQSTTTPVVSGRGFQGGRFYVSLPATTSPADQCDAGRFIESGTGDRCYRVRVRYNQNIFTAIDETILLCCALDGNVASNGVTLVPGNPQVTLSVRDRTNVATGVFLYTDGAQINQQVTGPIAVGTRISFRLSLTSEALTTYQDFRVTSCWITDSLGGNRMNIIVNSCPVINLYTIYRNFRKTNNPSRVYIDIAAFAFTNSNEAIMSCNVEPCTTPCPLSQCPNANSLNYGRKKRQTEEKQAEDRLVTLKFTIKLNDDDAMQCQEQRSCDFHDAFLPVAIVFAVLLIAAILAGVLLCVKMHKRESRATTHIPQAFFNPAVNKA